MVAMGDRTRASSRLRIHAWADQLRRTGVACDVLTYYDPAWLGRGPLARVPRVGAALRAGRFWRRVLDVACGADAVLLQEAVPPTSVARELRQRTGRLVFDISDPVHVSGAPGQTAVHHMVHRLIVQPRLRELLKKTDWVTVENDRVGEWAAGHGVQVTVIRGPVDTDRYRPCRPSDPVQDSAIVGWTGSLPTLDYLLPVIPVLNELHERRGGLRLVLFGVDRPTGAERLPVQAVPWDDPTEPAVVASFQIALNPIPDTPWTRLRGGAKLMTYMASGVPIVSSPSGIGDQVITSGTTGFLAASATDWRAALEWLLDNRALRIAMGDRARNEAVRRYSYDAYLPVVQRILLG